MCACGNPVQNRKLKQESLRGQVLIKGRLFQKKQVMKMILWFTDISFSSTANYFNKQEAPGHNSVWNIYLENWCTRCLHMQIRNTLKKYIVLMCSSFAYWNLIGCSILWCNNHHNSTRFRMRVSSPRICDVFHTLWTLNMHYMAKSWPAHPYMVAEYTIPFFYSVKDFC